MTTLNTSPWLHTAMRLGFHGLAVWWLWSAGVAWQGLVILGVCYVWSVLSLTVGFHRYFSHRSFKVGRFTQFAMGWLGCCQLQGGPIAWAAAHRHHHRHSDDVDDLHSPNHGLLWSHMGWLTAPGTYKVAFTPLKDLVRFPELVWLDRFNFVPAFLVFGGLWLAGTAWQSTYPHSIVDGVFALQWGGVVRVVLVWHVTWSVNSVCHVWGNRALPTRDGSRNNWYRALSAGEGCTIITITRPVMPELVMDGCSPISRLQ